MSGDNPVPGYRITGVRDSGKWSSFEYLKQSHTAAKLLRELWMAALSDGASCLDDDRFTSDDLPSDREAALMCSLCPVFDACKMYADTARPAWGVWAGVVKGRKLQLTMNEEDKNNE